MPIQYLSNTSPTMPRVIAISGHIKPTGGLRQLPDIPLVPLGALENGANRQGLAGRHTVEPRHFLNMPDVYYVCQCKIVIRHLTKRLSSLDIDRYSVAYPRTLIIEGCHIEPSGRCWIFATW